MEERIYFTSRISLHPKILEFNVIAASGNTWILKEDWSKDNNEFVHQITINKEERFEKYYYMEVEIYPVVNTTGKKICKLAKVSSSNIRFKINMKEYEGIIYPTKKRTSFEYKVVLSPIYKLILPFESEKKILQRRKRTMGHLIGGLKKLSAEIPSLLEDDTHADVILQCGNRKVRAHRNILCARSTWFNKKFHEMMAEDNDHMPKDKQADHSTILCNTGQNYDSPITIALHDLDVLIFDEFLYFIYAGIYKENHDLQTIKDLFIAACNYGVHDLEVKDFSYQTILQMDVMDFLDFACTFKIRHLEDMIIEHILDEEKFQNLNLVLEYSVQWESLLKRYPNIGNKFHRRKKSREEKETQTDISHENLVYQEERANDSVEDEIRHSGEHTNHPRDDGVNHASEEGGNHSGENGATHSGENGATHSGEDGATHSGENGATHSGEDGANQSGEDGANNSEVDAAYHSDDGVNHSDDGVNYSDDGVDHSGHEVHHLGEDGAYHSDEDGSNHLCEGRANHSEKDGTHHSNDGVNHLNEEEANHVNKYGAYHSDKDETYDSREPGTFHLPEDRTDTMPESRAVALYSDQCKPSPEDRSSSLSEDRTGSSPNDPADVSHEDLTVIVPVERAEVLPDDRAGVLFGNQFDVSLEQMADVLPEDQAAILRKDRADVLPED